MEFGAELPAQTIGAMPLSTHAALLVGSVVYPPIAMGEPDHRLATMLAGAHPLTALAVNPGLFGGSMVPQDGA